MEQGDVTTRAIRSRGLVLQVQSRASPSPRTAPVLVVRAAAEGEATIRPQAKALLPVADIVGVRIAGVSGPGTLPPHCGLDDLADGLAAVVDELGLPRVHVLGTSHGGEIAYRFAVRHPDRIDHLVLTGANGHRPHLPPDTSLAALATRARSSARHEVVDEIISSVLCLDPRRSVRGRATMHWALNDLFNGADNSHINQWIRCLQMLCEAPQPTGLSAALLVVTGEHDIAIRPTDSRALAAMSSQAVFATLQEADHWVFLTRTREHLDLTRRFLLDEPLEHLPYLAALERFPHPGLGRPTTPVPVGANPQAG
ncbi:alpha/beta fold hydrolase [Streptomyces sp. RKAG293]|uniref:alpha/beta fold hydrolase n=1 Tax=Streptomyces sp. RKAG293 TaxID=2893403 RepID=UPI002033A4F1|nr:alpha/beta hydrolase [Streptomyces sp. RKAG293]MCM2422695.1 alpha/beta hydrolase [Streptomyces sp. RKAG293]